jgi:hypothetical protein
MKKILFSAIFLFSITVTFSQIINIEILKIEEGIDLVFEDEFTNDSSGSIINNGNATFNNSYINDGLFNISPSSTTIVNGNYNTSGILDVIVNGPVAGDPIGYSQINVNGNLTLILPTVNVTIDPAYLPSDDTIHTIITYTGTLTGTFATVNIISTSGWYIDYSTSGEVNITRDSVLNVEDVNQVNLTVYPNPASNCISIDSSIEINKVKLFDMLGKLVISTTQLSEINVSHLPIGAYFLRIESKNGRTTKKIIIE